MVGFYFEKRRAVANGIAGCGSGVGMFIYAPLFYYLQVCTSSSLIHEGIRVKASVILNVKLPVM